MFVDKAALTFAEALPYFGKKGVVTGNPVRREFFEIGEPASNARTRLLIFGGSQGARAINAAMIDALPSLDRDGLEVMHQTGETEFDKVRRGYSEAGWDSADVRPYISEIVSEFARSDLVICRAGATTCAELAAAGKAAIMIPLPTAADDHQRKNAEAMVNGGAARMILQKDLTGDTLAKEIRDLIESPETIRNMEMAAKKLARRDAAEATVNLIEELGNKRQN
jgi:UDP-N-acetylglucosamine--N-acetylmuramyl-(pentapeptide) pyrophosphoryl-undecaprenol N-acetylglucosamine transferase